jgi:Lar family restriction alleviation protein
VKQPWKKKIKPCPFCGRVPHYMDDIIKSPNESSSFVRCDCGADGPGADHDDCIRAAAIDEWNRRTKRKVKP